MNNKIEELYGKRLVDSVEMRWNIEDSVYLVEMIVKDCASIVLNTDLEDVEGGDGAVLRAASEQLKKHFGVK